MATNNTMDWYNSQIDTTNTPKYTPEEIVAHIQGNYGIAGPAGYTPKQGISIFNDAAKFGVSAPELDAAMAGTPGWGIGTSQNFIDNQGLGNLSGVFGDAAIQQSTDSLPGYNLQPTLDAFDQNLKNAATSTSSTGQIGLSKIDSFAYKPKTTSGYMNTLAGVLDSNNPVLNQLAYNAGSDASARGFGRSTVASGIANRAMLEGASKLTASEIASQQFNVGEINRSLSELFGAKVDWNKVTVQQLYSMYNERMTAGNTAEAQKIADIVAVKQTIANNENRIATSQISADATLGAANIRADASAASDSTNTAISNADRAATAQQNKSELINKWTNFYSSGASDIMAGGLDPKAQKQQLANLEIVTNKSLVSLGANYGYSPEDLKYIFVGKGRYDGSQFTPTDTTTDTTSSTGFTHRGMV